MAQASGNCISLSEFGSEHCERMRFMISDLLLHNYCMQCLEARQSWDGPTLWLCVVGCFLIAVTSSFSVFVCH